MKYKLYNITDPSTKAVLKTGIMLVDENTTKSFLMDESNTDYQAYLKWLDEGNQPTPADEVTV
jgi:hypothetical protein